MSNIQTIKGKIEALRSLDEFDILNKEMGLHNTRAVPQKDIIEFEKRWKIKLPEDYKTLLIEIGPFCIVNLDCAPHHIFTLDERIPKSLLSTSFPFTTNWHPQYSLSENRNYFKKTYRGAILLAIGGCAVCDILIVSGAEYGHVWLDDRYSDGGVLPQPVQYPDSWDTDDGNRMMFYEWYIRHLDRKFQDRLFFHIRRPGS